MTVHATSGPLVPAVLQPACLPQLSAVLSVTPALALGTVVLVLPTVKFAPKKCSLTFPWSLNQASTSSTIFSDTEPTPSALPQPVLQPLFTPVLNQSLEDVKKSGRHVLGVIYFALCICTVICAFSPITPLNNHMTLTTSCVENIRRKRICWVILILLSNFKWYKAEQCCAINFIPSWSLSTHTHPSWSNNYSLDLAHFSSWGRFILNRKVALRKGGLVSISRLLLPEGLIL